MEQVLHTVLKGVEILVFGTAAVISNTVCGLCLFSPVILAGVAIYLKMKGRLHGRN
jgi:hypothetical protein